MDNGTPAVSSLLDFVAIDIETTGLNIQTDEIIELAAIRFRAGQVDKRFSTLVRPVKGVPKFIQMLTHIDPEDLKAAPDVTSALKDFFDFVGDDVLVGHNVSFDTGFINYHSALGGGPTLNRVAWDTAEISRVYFPFTTDHKLAIMTACLGIELNNAHRASADAEATGLLLVAMSEHAVKHYSLLTNARLLDLSKQAQLDDSLYNYLHKIVEYQRRYALIAKKPQPPQVARANVIDHDIPAGRMDISGIFSDDGLLSQKFPNFEFRSGQLEMARGIDANFRAGKHLAVEAGTGVGKSFAYLVPALAFAHEMKAKVIVSTNTKNLQEQLFFKDLPQLKEMLPLPFKASLVKGRENYICERRWQELLMEQARGITPYEAQALLYLFIWKLLTKSGDVSENSSFDRNRFNIVWRKVCSDFYLCLGRKCPLNGQCYVMNLRKHIETSSVVVTNHSLLLADLRMENTILGEYSYLVVDEAHNLMSAAARNLGFELSYADMANLLNQLSLAHRRKSTGFLHQLEQTLAKSVAPQGPRDHVSLICANLSEQITSLRKLVQELFVEAQQRCSEADSYGKLRIKDPSDFPRIYKILGSLVSAWKNFLKQLTALSNTFSTLNSQQVPNYDVLTDTIHSYLMRSSETEENLLALENPDLDENALWIENAYRPDSKNPVSTFCYAPVDVSTHLNRMLYETVPSIVFTSATLALRGSFKYFFSQSGLSLVPPEKMDTSIVDSPFDYDAQSRLMVGSFLPEHKDRFFTNQALGCVEQLVTTTNVGTMILFTSYRDLNNVYDHLSDTLYHNKRPFFAQGKTNSRTSMLEEFKRHNNAVLLGTNSFWEGVDIQGESLSLLILFKLPFQVPSEPVVEALIEKLDRENKDSFMHYMLPNALLKLRQGFGRLIRSKTDRGIVLIMDSRVSNKRYGEYFKQVLPTKCLEMRSELELLSEVSRFFNIS
jgi:ATP-dependent DNA helicase DinG